jgi:hypothetical protein
MTLPADHTSFYRFGGVDTFFTLADGPQLLEIQGTVLSAAPEPCTAVLGGAGVSLC